MQWDMAGTVQRTLLQVDWQAKMQACSCGCTAVAQGHASDDEEKWAITKKATTESHQIQTTLLFGVCDGSMSRGMQGNMDSHVHHDTFAFAMYMHT
jgi:hypothetical protein